jgi:hypothetical protein
VAHRRELGPQAVARGGCSQRQVFRFLRLNRSRYRYRAKFPSLRKQLVEQSIVDLSRKHPELGADKIGRLVRRERRRVSNARVREVRRATLRGCENLSKRLVGAVIAFNLSVLMRHLYGIGTAKQWEARVTRGHEGLMTVLNGLSNTVWLHFANLQRKHSSFHPPQRAPRIGLFAFGPEILANSTGC